MSFLFQLGSYQQLIFLCCMAPESLNHKLGARFRHNSCWAAAEASPSSLAGLYLLLASLARSLARSPLQKDSLKWWNLVFFCQRAKAPFVFRAWEETMSPEHSIFSWLRGPQRDALPRLHMESWEGGSASKLRESRKGVLHLVLAGDALINEISCWRRMAFWISEVIGDVFQGLHTASGCCTRQVVT